MVTMTGALALVEAAGRSLETRPARGLCGHDPGPERTGEVRRAG